MGTAWKYVLRGVTLAGILSLAFSNISKAQTTTGSIAGRVLEESGKSVEGAGITVTSPAIQGEMRATTDQKGEYHLSFVPPSQQTRISIEAGGYGQVSFIVIVSPGVVTTRDTVLSSTGSEQVVIAEAPAVAVRQATVPMILPEAEIRSIPVLGEFQDRSYQSIFYFSPTATHSRLSGNPAIAGATGIENVYMLDGIYTNNFVTGTYGTNLNVNFIREMDTEVYGVEAENGASTGGFFNLITKSGSNDFQGEIFGWTTAQNWTASEKENEFEVTEGRPWEAYDIGFDLGGPIVKDRLWFFLGYNPYYKTERNEGADLLRNTFNGGSIAIPYKYDKTWRTTTYIAKFNWKPGENHQLEFTVFGDPARQHIREGLIPTLRSISSASRRSMGSTNAGVKWYATITPRFFLETRVAMTRSKNELKPWLSGAEGYGRPQLVSQDWDSDLAISEGFGKFISDEMASSQLGVRGLWAPAGGFGHHEVTFGAELDDFDWEQVSGYTGGYMMQLRKQNGPDMFDPASYKNWYIYSVQDPEYNEKGSYSALFLQDRWTLFEELTVTAGLRWERNDLDSQRGNSLSLSSISPRLGVSWDFMGNDKSKLYFSCGRYYDRVPLYLAQTMDAGHASYKGTYVDGVKTGLATYNRNPAEPLDGVNNQSQDEFVLGIQWEAMPDLVIGARAVYRDLNKLLETVGIYDPSTGGIDLLIMNPGDQYTPLLESWRGVIPGYSAFPKPVRRYKALELLFEKRFKNNWFLQGNYTLSDLKGNTAAGYDRGVPELTPNATKEWDIPSSLWMRNRYGHLPTDRTHQLKVLGGYQFDNGLLVGATVRLDSGRPKCKLADWPKNEVGYGKLYVTPRGSEGRLPAALTINLHAEYTWKIMRTTLTVFVDVINLLNDQYDFRVEEGFYEKRSTWDETPVLNPDWGNVRSYTEPRAAAFGFKWAF
jgi:hypothetical protein